MNARRQWSLGGHPGGCLPQLFFQAILFGVILFQLLYFVSYFLFKFRPVGSLKCYESVKFWNLGCDGHDVECGPKMTEIVKTQSLKTAVDPSCKSSKK